ncbi:DUF5131 family protein [Bradyrhizobium sp. Gha]|uniref:DUF5131 family protein n=1 Tax=Bradyrhizobium sp. Gha TaxID=1855318 RepID=UPI0032DFAA91
MLDITRFKILTKRAERLASVANRLPRPNIVWMGVSVESEEYTDRMTICVRHRHSLSS